MINGMNVSAKTLSNGLEVLAISDSRFVKSSAALAVMAGSMQNPDEHLGLAHFLEHMLFLGTKEYPIVGDYEDFLNKNGGGHNAYTSIDHTNYFFDVAHSAFEGALQRFSRFFVSPTFDPQYVEREKNAVNSEHEKNRMEDSRREHRFMQLTTDPNHPYSKFATGDAETLQKADHDIVRNFYEGTYSANLMRLVLMSPLPLDEIHRLAQVHFSDIQNKNLGWPQYDDKVFSHLKDPLFHRVQSVRDQNLLKFSFAWPDDTNKWESKPTGLIAHLIGEEGAGSLLSYLKDKSWATGLETSTWWRMFHVRVRLTEEGKKHIDDIAKALFSTIQTYKTESLRNYTFTERQLLSQIELDNIEPKSSMDRASHFSASMLYYPADSFLERQYLYTTYSPEEFQSYLDYLRPENMQITLFENAEIAQGTTEEYYGITYKSEKVSQGLLKSLQQAQIIPEIFYPEANPYMPTDLSLVMEPTMTDPYVEDIGESVHLYTQTDTELKIPRAAISLTLISDVIQRNPRHFLCAKLFARLKNEELNEWAYPARLAGLNFHFSFGYNSLTMEAGGYSQHLSEFACDLIQDSKHGRRIDQLEVSEELFVRVKDKFKKALMNKEHDAAYQHLLYDMGVALTTASIHRHEYIDLVDEITLADIKLFAKQFFARTALRGFCHGNILHEKLKDVASFYQDKVGACTLSHKDVEAFENKFLIPPQGNSLFLMSGLNNNNAQLTLYPLSTWTIRDQAYISVLSKIIEQPYFTELRTQQQLGYIVAAFGSVSYGFTGLATLIQSQTHGAWDICQRSHIFMREFFAGIKEQLTGDDVQAICESIIDEIAIKPTALNERLSRFMMMAGTYHGQFDFFDKLIAEVRAINLASMQDYLEKTVTPYLLGDGSQRLCFLYRGQGHGDDVQGAEQFKTYKDLAEFKTGLQSHLPYRKD